MTALVAVPPYYGTGDPGWRAMLTPLRRDERELARYIAGGQLEQARAWRAYAIQGNIGAAPDGIWGPETDRLLTAYQVRHRLVADRVVGPKTQAVMLQQAGERAEAQDTAIVDHLLRGFIEFEGAHCLCPTNWYTPPDQDPGVDCGPGQRRRYGPPFSLTELKVSFRTVSSLRDAGSTTMKRAADYRTRRPTLTKWDALVCACLAWNAPFLAEQIVRNGRLTTPTATATWTVRTVDPQGHVTSRYTHAEWAKVYPDRLLTYVERF